MNCFTLLVLCVSCYFIFLIQSWHYFYEALRSEKQLKKIQVLLLKKFVISPYVPQREYWAGNSIFLVLKLYLFQTILQIFSTVILTVWLFSFNYLLNINYENLSCRAVKLKESHDLLAQSGIFCSCHWIIMVWLIFNSFTRFILLTSKIWIFCNVWYRFSVVTAGCCDVKEVQPVRWKNNDRRNSPRIWKMKLIEVVGTIHEHMLKKIIQFGRFITQKKNIFHFEC